MTRRKKGDPAAERVAAAIMEEFSPKTAEEAQDALRSVFGPMIETMLRAELEAHLGYPDNDKGPKDGPNRRNGYTRKVVRTSAGEVPIDVPRDRDATFEPAVVPKGERDLTGIESRVMSMYARGMSQRDIAATVREIYGFSMSAETVSAITDRVWEELERWRSRPLEPVYAFMFVDCLYVPVRRGRGARSMAVYAIVAYDLAGRKDVLGLWMQEAEGAHHWMGVFDELRQRGVEDVLFVGMDGVSGLADGLRAIFPDAVAQRCLVHLVRNSCKYVPSKDMQAFCRDARAFYGAPSLSACRAAFAGFSEAWARCPGAVATWERSMAEVERLFSYGPDVRRVMYTTNAVESVNASFRKVVRRGCFPGVTVNIVCATFANLFRQACQCKCAMCANAFPPIGMAPIRYTTPFSSRQQVLEPAGPARYFHHAAVVAHPVGDGARGDLVTPNADHDAHVRGDGGPLLVSRMC